MLLLLVRKPIITSGSVSDVPQPAGKEGEVNLVSCVTSLASPGLYIETDLYVEFSLRSKTSAEQCQMKCTNSKKVLLLQ